MVKKIVGTGVLLVLALALQAGVKMYTLGIFSKCP